MTDNDRGDQRHDSFDEFLSANLSDELSSGVEGKVTPWSDALNLILLGIALGLVNIEGSFIGLLLHAGSSACSLLGWNRLRGENKSFRCGWILILIRTALFLFTTLLDLTIYTLDDLLSANAQYLLSIVFFLLFIAQLIFLRDGISEVQKKAGTGTGTSPVTPLITSYIILFLLRNSPIGLVMFIPIVAALFFLARFSHTLDEAGYVIAPAPVKVSQGSVLCLFLGVLLLGALLCFLFFGRYPMKWEKKTPPSSQSLTEIGVPTLPTDASRGHARLKELGVPEDVLNDLTADDLADCTDALSVLQNESDYFYAGLDGGLGTAPLHLRGFAVVLSDAPSKWKIIYHFSLPDQKHYWGTDALEIFPQRLFGVSEFAGPPHGRILTGQGEGEKAAGIPSVRFEDYASAGNVSFFPPMASGLSGQVYYASFSLPNGYKNARGYVSFIVEEPYPPIDPSWGEDTALIIRANFCDGLYYIHQTETLQYPVLPAKAYGKAGFRNVFTRVQLLSTFPPTD